MWKLYEQLIDEVHDGKVLDATVGLSWTAIESNTVGLAMGAPRPKKNFRLAGKLKCMSVRELASYVKSWEQVEASVGLSAINSSVNTEKTIQRLQQQGFALNEETSIFDTLTKVAPGKKIAVVGHFPVLDKLQQVCELTVLERAPQEGDLPDPAAEYILHEQDIVVMTSSTIINKTAPRLLQLSKNAFCIMVGPSTPLSPVLFELGADMIAGLVVEDKAGVIQNVKEGGGLKGYRDYVRYVNMYKKNHPIAKQLYPYEGVINHE